MDSFINKVLEKHETSLDLSNRGLYALDFDMSRLNTVERLALNGNSLSTLPDCFSVLKSLRYLNIKGNKFTKFPAILCSVEWLEILDISRNEIEALPDSLQSMTSLKILSIEYNDIKLLPRCIADMKSLSVLKIKGNPLNPVQIGEKIISNYNNDGQSQTREIKKSVRSYYSTLHESTETSSIQKFEEILRNSPQMSQSFDINKEIIHSITFMLTRIQQLFDRYYDTETMESYIQFSLRLNQILEKLSVQSAIFDGQELWLDLMDLIQIGRRMLVSVKPSGCSQNLMLAKEQSLLMFTIANFCREACQLIVSEYNQSLFFASKSSTERVHANIISQTEMSIQFARVALGLLKQLENTIGDSIVDHIASVEESISFIESQVTVLKVTTVTPQMFQVFSYHVNIYLSRSAKLAHSFKSIVAQKKFHQNVLISMQNFTRSIKSLAASLQNQRR